MRVPSILFPTVAQLPVPAAPFLSEKRNVSTNIAKAVIIPTANLVVEFMGMVVYLVFRFARLAWWQSCQEIHALGLQLL